MKKLILFILLWKITTSINAQSKILDQYITSGIENNLSLKQEKLELNKAMKSIEIAKTSLFPRITFAPTYTLAAGGRRLQFPIGDLLNPVYNTLNKLTQSSSFPQVENVDELLAPNNFHDTKISLQYPIFNSDIKYNIALQKELLQTEYAKKKTLEFEIKHSIEIAYFQYLQAVEAIKIYEQSRGILQQVDQLNRKLVDQKVALKDVLLTSEYEITKLEQQIMVAQKNKDLAKAYFNFLLNKDLSEEIVIDSSLTNTLPIFPDLAILNENALVFRPEFNQINSGLKVNDANILLQQKNAKLPQVFVGGNMGFQGFGYTFTNQAYALAQFGISWDLYHGNEKKHRVQQSKISKSILELKKEELKKQILLQVNQNFRELQASVSNYHSTKGGIEKTQKILEIVNSRYKNGNAIFVEVSKAQNDDLISKLSESLAKYDVWVKFANLKKVSGY
jgi:outer membrane protein